MEIRLSGHSAYHTEYHIVWIPKYRYHVLNPGVQAYLVKLFPKVMAQLPGCEIVKYNIQTVNSGESKTFYPHEVLTPMGSDLLVELKSNSGTTLYSKQYTYDEFLAIFVRINGSSYWIGN